MVGYVPSGGRAPRFRLTDRRHATERDIEETMRELQDLRHGIRADVHRRRTDLSTSQDRVHSLANQIQPYLDAKAATHLRVMSTSPPTPSALSASVDAGLSGSFRSSAPLSPSASMRGGGGAGGPLEMMRRGLEEDRLSSLAATRGSVWGGGR